MLSSESNDACSSLEEVMLESLVRVKIQDGRVIEGVLVCIDNFMNLIVNSATEYHGKEVIDFQEDDESSSTTNNQEDNGSKTLKRKLGTIMIPGDSITNVCRMKVI